MIETDVNETALYNRTSQQRLEHRGHVQELAGEYPDVSAEHIIRIANQRMRKDFYAQLSRLANKQAFRMSQNIADPHCYETLERRQAVALLHVKADIALLHQVLPLGSDASPGAETAGGAPQPTPHDEQHVFKGRRPPKELPNDSFSAS